MRSFLRDIEGGLLKYACEYLGTKLEIIEVYASNGFSDRTKNWETTNWTFDWTISQDGETTPIWLSIDLGKT